MTLRGQYGNSSLNGASQRWSGGGKTSFHSYPTRQRAALSCCYIDNLQDRLPGAVDNLLVTRLSNHSGVALSELTHLFGRLNPRDSRTEAVLAKIRAAISLIPPHRLTGPSINVLGEAGILAGLVARLAGIDSGRRQALLNDAVLFLQALEQGQTLLTRSIREFDWFDQLLPIGRVLFYRTI